MAYLWQNLNFNHFLVLVRIILVGHVGVSRRVYGPVAQMTHVRRGPARDIIFACNTFRGRIDKVVTSRRSELQIVRFMRNSAHFRLSDRRVNVVIGVMKLPRT